MLNPIATEALYSATYVDNYIDSVENLPDDVQRYLSRIRDIDVQYRSHLQDVDHYYDLWQTLQSQPECSSSRKARAIARMQQSLIQAQELGDEKMAVVNQLQELIDSKTRQLDTDQKNLDIKEDIQQQHRVDSIQPMDDYSGPTAPKQTRMQSPTRGEQLLGNAYTPAVGSGGSSSGGGRSTPNSERSGNNNAPSSNGPNSAAGLSVNSSNMAQLETQRHTTKRSRRRNDTANMMANLELGSNESNSATEVCNTLGSERGSAQKSGIGSAQKKNTSHQGAGGTGGSGNVAGSNTGGGGGGGSANNSGKKKKRKARGGAQSNNNQVNLREETPPPDPIDPDEPTYCVCNQISFGEMILCDNDLCPIEWFHFSCVSLVLKPKGKWFCPNCRGDRPNVMKPKAQFLKELERYNKEKEEKT